MPGVRWFIVSRLGLRVMPAWMSWPGNISRLLVFQRELETRAIH
jgi:hypothetical protein